MKRLALLLALLCLFLCVPVWTESRLHRSPPRTARPGLRYAELPGYGLTWVLVNEDGSVRVGGTQ